jgi:hypothetical protein
MMMSNPSNAGMSRLMAHLAFLEHVDHGRSKTREELDALTYGSAKCLDPAMDLGIFLNAPLEFGSFLGQSLTILILETDGTIAGIHHENESIWGIRDSTLFLGDKEQCPSTVFDVVLEHNQLTWLIGRFRDGRAVHYLTPARHRRPPSLHTPKVIPF